MALHRNNKGSRGTDHHSEIEKSLEKIHHHIHKAGYNITAMLTFRKYWRSDAQQSIRHLAEATRELEKLTGETNDRTSTSRM